LIFCRDANSGLGSGKELFFFSGAGFLTTLRSDILSDSGSPTGSLLHHTPSSGNSCWIGTISYETFVETDFFCVPRFPMSVCWYKILGRQTSFTLY